MNSIMLASLLTPLQLAHQPDEAAIRLTQACVAFQAGIEARADATRARRLFQEAAAGFDSAWDAGDHSARVAGLRGRGHYLAGDRPGAVVAFRAGLMETPYDGALLRGLAECRAAIPYPTAATAEERLRPDPPHGWRNRVSGWDVFRLAVLAVSLVVVGLARRLTARDGWAIPVAVLGGVGLLACAVIAWTLNAEAATERETPGLVVTADATLRTGNGFSYPPRVAVTLPPGTEVVERTRRGGWAQVEVAGGAVGWLPASAVRRVE